MTHCDARRFTPASQLAAKLGLILLVGGCAEPTAGVVAGAVTVDGAAATSGSIAFFPTNGKSATAGAEIIAGQYRATVPLGSAKVEIRVPKVVGERKLYDAPNSPVKQVLAESLPSQYNDQTELTIDVKPGKNPHDYALTTK